MRTRLLSFLLLCSAALCGCREERTWLQKSHAAIASYEAGRYEESLSAAQEALLIAREAFGPDDLRTAYVQDHAGKSLMRLGRLEQARPYLEGALAVKERTLDPGDPRLGYYLIELGELEARSGNHDAAEALYQRALELYRGSYGEISLPAALAHVRLGALYKAWGVHEEAERTLRRAEAIALRLEAPAPEVSAAVDAGLCGIFAEARRLEEAAGRCVSGLAGLRKALPPGHADLAGVLTDEGLYLLRSGRLAEAREDLERGRGLLFRFPGCDPGFLLSNRLAYAELLEAEGKGGEAEEVLPKVLARFEGSHSAVKALVRGAAFYARRGERAMAETLFRSAALKHEESPKADAADREEALAGLAALQLAAGRRASAGRFLDRAWEGRGAFHGRGHLPLAEAFLSYGAASLRAGDTADARRALERAETLVTGLGRREAAAEALRERAGLLRARIGREEGPRVVSHRSF